MAVPAATAPANRPPTRRAEAPGAVRGPALLMRPAAKAVLFMLCLLPFAWLLRGAVLSTLGTSALGANPAEALIRATGDWTLRFVCITLAVTPARQWRPLAGLARMRRMLGLFAFFYAVLHALCYGWLDMGLDFGDIAHDIAKRPFILVGTACWLLLLPLAATSTNRMIRALGADRWRALHRTVYAVALLALLHFFWMRSAKSNYREVAVYAAVVMLLLGWRVLRWGRSRGRRRL